MKRIFIVLIIIMVLGLIMWELGSGYQSVDIRQVLMKHDETQITFHAKESCRVTINLTITDGESEYQIQELISLDKTGTVKYGLKEEIQDFFSENAIISNAEIEKVEVLKATSAVGKIGKVLGAVSGMLIFVLACVSVFKWLF